LLSFYALTGLTWETIIALPVSLIYLIYIEVQGTSTFASMPAFHIVPLLLSGPATAWPLFWLVGFIQYIAPTTSLLLAVFLFHEPFTHWQLISFSFIWLALIVYSVASFRSSITNKHEIKQV
jgi:chloramphenicol-sensitive protein RarD